MLKTIEADSQNSLKPTLETLESCWDSMNAFTFNLKARPVITIQSKGRKDALGWFWADKWKAGKAPAPELNISAEYLTRPFQDVLRTLAHEMVHHKAFEEGIKDTSREGRWHNKRFAKLAEAHGMEAPPHAEGSLGYSAVVFGPRWKGELDGLESKFGGFDLARTGETLGKEAGKGKMLLWECGCGVKLRSGRKDLNILCQDCDGVFSLQGV